MTETQRQEVLDLEHLRLLRIGFLIAGGANVFWALFPLIHVTMGILIMFGQFDGAADRGARSAGMVFVVIGLTFSIVLAAVAVMKFMTARAIANRRSRTFCLVTAAITCLGMPYGTALGVFTFLVLSRRSVIAQFVQNGRHSSEPAV
jgi:hypothetical protein